jgi:DNA-binding NarL/FixJ family response regulator
MPARVVLADDHEIVRQGLRAILERAGEFLLVAEAGSGPEVLPVVDRARPDVLVLDVMMPGLNGLEVARRVHHRHPGVKIVMLSVHSNESYVLEALRAGASAYLLKSGSSQELVEAVRTVVSGKRYLSAPLSERAIDAYARMAEGTADPYDALTAREREVLQLVAEGRSSQAIAEELGISVRTVESHRGSLLRKLGLGGQVDVVRYCIRRGLTPAE